ncbi:hypothetical protein DdX_15497 [Ditylenchus destructor]|uniref:Uncharacterized protein n=1 Tax=Ditylenchus destructor TaxID=166010 RepID=A0AAD4QUP9_9BILA|nr:hypothetical protein DdX_15497 [Ditylenchus destructor]
MKAGERAAASQGHSFGADASSSPNSGEVGPPAQQSQDRRAHSCVLPLLFQSQESVCLPRPAKIALTCLPALSPLGPAESASCDQLSLQIHSHKILAPEFCASVPPTELAEGQIHALNGIAAILWILLFSGSRAGRLTSWQTIQRKWGSCSIRQPVTQPFGYYRLLGLLAAVPGPWDFQLLSWISCRRTSQVTAFKSAD